MFENAEGIPLILAGAGMIDSVRLKTDEARIQRLVDVGLFSSGLFMVICGMKILLGRKIN